ncbi:hypothetical protein NKH77_39460 [Streptomyces sp. M19]
MMVLHIPASKRGLHLGLVPQDAAARHPHTPITLDHDLDAAPEAGAG